MKKHDKRSKDSATVAPMFARYLTGPSLKSVNGGLVVNQKTCRARSRRSSSR